MAAAAAASAVVAEEVFKKLTAAASVDSRIASRPHRVPWASSAWRVRHSPGAGV